MYKLSPTTLYAHIAGGFSLEMIELYLVVVIQADACSFILHIV